jgi:hypothetical protein
MKPSEHEKLLKAILPEEDSSHFQRASLEYGLTHLRRQRRRGYLARAGALAAVACLATMELVKWHHPARRDGSNPQLSSTPRPAQATSSQVKFISDDELLALFPNRPVALIGKPGQQRLVFLDQTHSTPARSPF